MDVRYFFRSSACRNSKRLIPGLSTCISLGMALDFYCALGRSNYDLVASQACEKTKTKVRIPLNASHHPHLSPPLQAWVWSFVFVF